MQDSLEGFEGFMESGTAKLVGQLEAAAQAGDLINIHATFQILTLEIIARSAFGVRHGTCWPPPASSQIAEHTGQVATACSSRPIMLHYEGARGKGVGGWGGGGPGCCLCSF